eukprot:1159631-Pelagomonas_calceolata.AAC.3
MRYTSLGMAARLTAPEATITSTTGARTTVVSSPSIKAMQWGPHYKRVAPVWTIHPRNMEVRKEEEKEMGKQRKGGTSNGWQGFSALVPSTSPFAQTREHYTKVLEWALEMLTAMRKVLQQLQLPVAHMRNN